jgi:hypothetical protein
MRDTLLGDVVGYDNFLVVSQFGGVGFVFEFLAGY